MKANQSSFNASSMHIFTLVAPSLVLAITLFTGCNTGREKPANDVDTTRYQIATEEGPGQDPAIHLTPQVVKFQGAEYTISVERAPSDSLPLVKDSYGDPYRDNIVTINITRDGTPCVSRRFQKTDFAQAAADIELGKLTLGGMAFTRLDDTGCHFGAQLCTPGDVEGGYAFSITLPLSGGNPNIKRDNNITNIADEFVD